LRWKEHLGAETQPTNIGHPHRQPEWRQQLANALAVGPGEQRREVVEHRVRDRVELERLATQHRRVGSEDAETLVLPPDVLRSPLVMRDTEATFAFAAFETPVAQQRSEDDLDLHRIRHDAPEHAFWMLPHDMNVGTGLLPIVSSLPR